MLHTLHITHHALCIIYITHYVIGILHIISILCFRSQRGDVLVVSYGGVARNLGFAVCRKEGKEWKGDGRISDSRTLTRLSMSLLIDKQMCERSAQSLIFLTSEQVNEEKQIQTPARYHHQHLTPSPS